MKFLRAPHTAKATGRRCAHTQDFFRFADRIRKNFTSEVPMLHTPTRTPSKPRLRLLLLLLAAVLLTACARSSGANDPAYVDAVELKLKCRELADQMLATVPNEALQGVVALPTSFVEQNNRSASSPLGRLISEALIYEFNQRGFPVQEYRLSGKVSITGGRNDLAFLNNATIPVGQKWAALIVGTYYVDKDATFVNARLVRATDGLVLRTGQLVLVNTGIVQRMSEGDAVVAARASAASKPPKYGQNGYYPPLYTPGSGLNSGSLTIRQGR